MTTIPPPSQQFTGLFYNPSFWISSTTSLTQDVANTLYLRKTTTDFASALETFNGGISSQSMTAPSLTADVILFPNQTAGTLRLASAARSVHCSNVDCQGSSINNASTPANGAISIGSSQTGTGGTISIGTNAARTGAITIGANACTVNLGGYLTPTYTTMPSSTTQVGTITTTTPGAGLTLGTSYSTIGSLISIPAGVWLLQGSCTLPITVVGTVVTLSLNTSAAINQAAKSSGVVTTAGGVSVEVSLMISQSGSGTWGLQGIATSATTVITNPRFIYTRIA